MTQWKEFWNWYFGLFIDPDNKIRIAAWAATVTTVGFLLTFVFKPLLASLRRSFSKVRVKAGISHQIITSAFGTGAGVPLMTCTITNHQSKTVYIANPAIHLSEAIDGEKTFVVPKPQGKFPMRLDAGQQVTIDYNTIDLYQQLLRNVSAKSKVGFVVTTTTGKKYYSNKFTRKHITGQINLASDLNR